MPNKLRLNRQQLAAFLPNAEAIRAFEQVFDFTTSTPSTIEEAAALAGMAAAAAQQALAMLADVAAALEQLGSAPAPAIAVNAEDMAPPAVAHQQQDDFTPPTAPPVAVDVGPDAIDLATGLTLANNMRSVLIANGFAT